MKYKLIISDIDGVWTDGSFYYSEEGDVIRKFSTKDSYGVSLCQIADVPLMIISTEENKMVQRRMQKLQVDHVNLGVRNKLEVITAYCEKKNIKLSEVAYLGDDMNDYHLLDNIGLFACPADAYKLLKEKANLILKTEGGKGVFREFVETLLEQAGLLQDAYHQYTKQCLEK